MSKAILRRNSSKAGLQNLLTVTAQRSIEDAEEVERERRRRARESFRRTSSGGPGGECSLDNGTPAEEEDHDSTYDGNLKPSSSPSLEEDEGFSDWTQRREKRRQQRMQELSQEPEEEKRRQQRMQELSQEPEEDEEKALPNGEQTTSSTRGGGGLQDLKTPTAALTTSSSKRLHRQHREQEEEEKTRTSSERRKELEEEEEPAFRVDQARREKEREAGEQRTREEQRRAAKKMEELQKSQAEVEKRKEVKVSYTSKVFLHQEAKPSSIAAGHRDAVREDVTSSCNNNKSKRPSGNRVAVQAAVPDHPEVVVPETEQRLEKIRRSHQEKESQELEQLRHRQVEAEQELEELKKRRGERRRVREDEERRREEDDQHRLAKEEEEKRRMKGDMEKRRQEAAERMKIFSSTSVDGDEMMLSAFSPKSPILKKGNEEVLTAESACSITERTQSLNRSLKKSNSFKKTHPPVLLTKIDDKREQYTHAVENSQEAKAVKQGVMDINSPPEAVSSKKNLFEGGEVWIQSPTKGTSCKDTEDLKVGVADLITQWVKGNPDGSGKQSPSRPADVKPGDVMNKKNMWEIISDTSGRTGQKTSGTPTGKTYKFVVTGHGKYEKKPDDNGEEYPNGKSDLCQDDY